ncbi:hypothetical protein L195_g027479 [Trifolium pratense]|uniref:Uncharacterized protein n=1 Tax=Trifolium pratense TaxID=57577 RepID=A0A2K3KZB9_TRIPR|nr:hypothetical protein L195_g027479 [Trifolium pratense]
MQTLNAVNVVTCITKKTMAASIDPMFIEEVMELMELNPSRNSFIGLPGVKVFQPNNARG